MGICYCPLGPKASVPETTNIFFWLMLRAQIGQCAVFKTPTKLQHPYCNIFEAIAIGKLDLVLDRRNVSLFRDLATEPIFTLRIRTPEEYWSPDGNWSLFFSSNFHTPPVTTPVRNLCHVQIHKITGPCIYYCIVNTWVRCRRIYEIGSRPSIFVFISGRF